MPAFLDSSMVEHAAVNRGVVGSSPTRGVKPVNIRVYGLFDHHFKDAPNFLNSSSFFMEPFSLPWAVKTPIFLSPR